MTEFKARDRDVYLPAGADWYDFHTGRALRRAARRSRPPRPMSGCRCSCAPASIVPTGPAMQYTRRAARRADHAERLHRRGRRFSLYEDDGVSTAIEQGEFARIPLRWDEATRTLTIGAREGSYPGMVATRAVSVRFHTPGKAEAVDFAENGATRVSYTGKAMTVRMK